MRMETEQTRTGLHTVAFDVSPEILEDHRAPGDLLARCRADRDRDLGEVLMDVLGDQRRYVVSLEPWHRSARTFDGVRFTREALAVLARPDDARVGELVQESALHGSGVDTDRCLMNVLSPMPARSGPPDPGRLVAFEPRTFHAELFRTAGGVRVRVWERVS